MRFTTALSLVCGLAAGVALALSITVEASALAEDAAMLMRYAQHLAQGHGYVWNIGEPPVDGATDWLGTTLLGGLYAMGMSLELGPRVLAGAAHALTVALVVALMRTAFRAPVVATIVSAAFLIAGPARMHVEAGFLAPLFALAVLAAWSCVVMAAEDGRRRWAPLFALAGALSVLARPEALALIPLMLLAACFLLDGRRLRMFGVSVAVITIPVLVVFVLWRWNYFGRLLPLPFLKKGGGTLHLDGLQESIRGGALLLWWAVAAAAFGLRRGRSVRWAAALAVVCGGFVGVWILLSSEMNYFWRFQYCLVPIAAASWWGVAGEGWREMAAAARGLKVPSQRVLIVASVAVLVAALALHARRFRTSYARDGLLSAATILRDLGGPERRLVTTEAGLLPLYSGWTSIDAWGLNTPRIVAAGRLTPEYLAEFDPDVIMFHAHYTPVSPERSPPDAWDAMVRTLHRFAACHDYVLAAAFAPEFSQAHYYFVRRSWERRDAFTRALKAAPYSWWGTAASARDYSAFETRTAACE